MTRERGALAMLGAGAALAMGLSAAAGLGAPMPLPEPPQIVRRVGARIPGPKRKQPGHPFRTRRLNFDEPADRERKFLEHVAHQLGVKELSKGWRTIALRHFKLGSSGHVASRKARQYGAMFD